MIGMAEGKFLAADLGKAVHFTGIGVPGVRNHLIDENAEDPYVRMSENLKTEKSVENGSAHLLPIFCIIPLPVRIPFLFGFGIQCR
jgi:hypothetical protein